MHAAAHSRRLCLSASLQVQQFHLATNSLIFFFIACHLCWFTSTWRISVAETARGNHSWCTYNWFFTRLPCGYCDTPAHCAPGLLADSLLVLTASFWQMRCATGRAGAGTQLANSVRFTHFPLFSNCSILLFTGVLKTLLIAIARIWPARLVAVYRALAPFHVLHAFGVFPPKVRCRALRVLT